MTRILTLLCLMLAVASPAFGQGYATFAPVPLCAPNYETFQPVPISVPSAAPMRQRAVYHALSYEWHITRGENEQSLREHVTTPSVEHHNQYIRDRQWVNLLDLHSLVGVHSDLHNNRVQWQWVGRYEPGMVQPTAPPRVRVQYQEPRRSPGIVSGFFQGLFGSPRSSGSCPGGNCPRN
jgi:hypothetical protein